MVAALSRLYSDQAEGANSDDVITAVGEKLSAVLDEARGLSDAKSSTREDSTSKAH
ncbi:hypothetical protein [Methylobacterium brachythecii]|uniref:hypothetical protein n=1 Tax=Methylobacterium brachythecii TaxID=1176177 RepID=UPI0024E1333B|nr:hypothetical protein [Methylobacterium brachythecii]